MYTFLLVRITALLFGICERHQRLPLVAPYLGTDRKQREEENEEERKERLQRAAFTLSPM